MAGLHFDITGDNSNFLRKLEETRNGVRAASKQIEESGMSIEQMFGRMAKGVALFGAGFSASQFIKDMINVRGEFQKTQMAFETMLGSKEKADALMTQMVQTAAKTPFDLQGVANGAKQLLAYGTAAEDVNDTLIRLGNIASGLSIPLGDMVYLFGTTASQGRLFTQDVRQFMGRGIPLVKELATMLGKTEEEINKMVTAGQIGFSEVEKVIKKMTDEGGQFYSLMEKQSETLSGQISNLGDAWDGMLNSIGEETQGVSSATISMATGIVENYERIGKVLVSLIGLYGTYKAATVAYYVITQTYGVYDIATKELQFAATMKNIVATKAMTIQQALLNKTMLANPYVLIATIVAGLVVTMWALHDSTTAAEKAQKQLNKEHEEAAQRKQELTSKTDSLISKINSETDSVYLQVKAYKELLKLYPELGNMSFEEFKNLPQDQQKKMFSSINEKREIDDSQKAYEADLNRIEYLKKAINTTAMLPNSGITLSKLNEQLDTANNLAKLHKEEIERIKQIQWEANTPVEEKIKHYEDVKKRLVEEKEELDKTLTKSENIASVWMAVPDIIGNIKLDALNKQIDETTGKIDSLTGNDKTVVKNKSYWEQKKKDAETARDALATSEKNSEKWNKYTREIQQAQNEIAKYDTTGKTENEAKKKLKLQQDHSDILLEISRNAKERENAERQTAFEIEQAKIDIMKDGFVKEQTQIDLNHQKALQGITLRGEEMLKAQQESERKQWEKDGKKGVFTPKTMSVSQLSTEQLQQLAGLMNGVVAKTDHDNQELFDSMVKKYSTYTEQRKEIEKKFDDDIAAMQKKNTGGEYDANIKEADKLKTKALSDLDSSIIANKSMWSRLFSDTSAMSKR